MKNGHILLIIGPRVVNQVPLPINRVNLSFDITRTHFRLSAIDLDTKIGYILLNNGPKVVIIVSTSP